ALLDTLADRLGEAAIWIGLVYFVGGEPRLATLAVVGLCASMLVPYVRSKAEGWGATGRGGLMGRAERLIVMLIGIGLEGLDVSALEPMLWILATTTWLTVGQRAWRTWRQLEE
ncbi:MAG: CDP-alcohol phosphatidyltransferase family protein, partial [Acidimicrobiia bacterium]|nr:CDP-alcohol phosphatidyltransferase family protein [Acidimicrobiia bacterium]